MLESLAKKFAKSLTPEEVIYLGTGPGWGEFEEYFQSLVYDELWPADDIDQEGLTELED